MFRARDATKVDGPHDSLLSAKRHSHRSDESLAARLQRQRSSRAFFTNEWQFTIRRRDVAQINVTANGISTTATSPPRSGSRWNILMERLDRQQPEHASGQQHHSAFPTSTANRLM
jgi:hypothetical protein